MGKPLVRFCEGQGYHYDMDEILWHRRESRRQQRTQTSSCSHGSSLPTRKYWNDGMMETLQSHYSNIPLLHHSRSRQRGCAYRDKPADGEHPLRVER
jgi:hypothetical protein